jgi:hypothetical protein
LRIEDVAFLLVGLLSGTDTIQLPLQAGLPVLEFMVALLERTELILALHDLFFVFVDVSLLLFHLIFILFFFFGQLKFHGLDLFLRSLMPFVYFLEQVLRLRQVYLVVFKLCLHFLTLVVLFIELQFQFILLDANVRSLLLDFLDFFFFVGDLVLLLLDQILERRLLFVLRLQFLSELALLLFLFFLPLLPLLIVFFLIPLSFLFELTLQLANVAGCLTLVLVLIFQLFHLFR